MSDKKKEITVCGRLIFDLSGMDPKFRQSSKFAALEIANAGAGLFEVVFKAAMSGKGNDAERCAEACARAAGLNPMLAENASSRIIDSLLKCQNSRLKYFLSVMLINVKVPKAKAAKCAAVILKWLKAETGKGPKAAFLEAIAYLALTDEKLKPLASRMLDDALKSPVASYSARARQIIMYGKRRSNGV